MAILHTIYHSGFGHTKLQAQSVHHGASSVSGVQTHLWTVEEAISRSLRPADRGNHRTLGERKKRLAFDRNCFSGSGDCRRSAVFKSFAGILGRQREFWGMEGVSIWTNLRLCDQAEAYLIRETKGHRLTIVPPGEDVLQVGTIDHRLRDSDIAFGQPNPEDLQNSSPLRWAHLSSAGYTRYDTPELRAAFGKRQVILTNSSAVFSEPCAQHALGGLLGETRQLYRSFRNQPPDGAWPQNDMRSKCHLLGDQPVLIVGFGSIGH